MINYKYIKVKKALSLSELSDVDYTLNPYIGCEHSCIYCYAPNYTGIREVSENWGSVIIIKENIANILENEIKKIKKETITISTITDPYQPIEASFKLTRKCLEVLSRYNIHTSIQTKSILALRDKDLVVPEKFDIGVTITSLNSSIAKLLEPKASNPKDRVRIIEEFSSMGVETWVFMGPIIPKYTDNLYNIEEVIKLCKETKSALIIDKLRLKPVVIKRIMKKLNNAEEVLRICRNSNYWFRVFNLIRRYCKKYNVEYVFSKPKVNTEFITKFLQY